MLRLGRLVGPGQPAHQLLPTLVRQLRSGVVRIHRGATRDLIGAADATTLVDLPLGLRLPAESVNVASGFDVPVEDIVDHLGRRLGLAARREYQDAGAGRHAVSTEKLRRLVPRAPTLGFGPGYYRRVLDEFARTVPD